MNSKTPEFVSSAPDAEQVARAVGSQAEGFATQWSRSPALLSPLCSAGRAIRVWPLCPIIPARYLRCVQREPSLTASCNGSDSIDAGVLAYQIRQLPPEVLNGNEKSLRALIRRHLKRPEKSEADRDKIDFLLVQYFALSASEELCRKDITLEDVATVLKPALPGADPTPLEWCEPLEQILGKVTLCSSLRDMMEDGLLGAGAPAEGCGRLHVLRSRRSGGLLPI